MLRVASGLVWLGLALSIAAPATAATVVVNTFEQVDASRCTLASAIESANADADRGGCTHSGDYGADTIVLALGTYALRSALAGDTALPPIASEIAVAGNGATIARPLGDSAPFFRIFLVTQGTLSLENLTVSGGLLRAPGGTAVGGGIHVRDGGSLSLTNVTLSQHAVDVSATTGSAGTARGGALHFEGAGTLTLTDVTIAGNTVRADGGAGGGAGLAQGGGIAFTAGTAMTFTRGAVVDNVASADAGLGGFGLFARGGGIFASPQAVDGAGVALSGVIVGGNVAHANGGSGGHAGFAEGGGVLYQKGAGAGGLRIADSTFRDNLATANGMTGTRGGAALGGGLHHVTPGTVDTVPITRSAFVRNAVQAHGGAIAPAPAGTARGGGIYFQSGATGLDLTSVTVAGNLANADPGAGGGGGVVAGAGAAYDGGGLLTANNVTITANTANAPGGAASGAGLAATASVTLRSSIVIWNGATADCAGGAITSLGHNLIPSGGGCGSGGPGDKIGVAPGLGPIVDLGRAGAAFAPPQPTSAAIDGGDPSTCPAIDQIGQGRRGSCDIGAVEIVAGTGLVASVLPSSRSGLVGAPLTAFASVVNVGAEAAYQVGIALATAVPAAFSFRLTDPATNAPIGPPNTPIDVAPGQAQTYVITLASRAAFGPTEVALAFTGTNTAPVVPVSGLNTLLVSASATPVADVVALAATLLGDGIVDVPGDVGTGVFSVATANLGAGGAITVSADTGGAAIPVTPFVCRTDPATAACVSALAPRIETPIGSGETPTFAVFVAGGGTVPFEPAANRVFVRFTDASGAARGGTSVAVRTR